MRWARVSVSVSLEKRCPARSSAARSTSAFSMMPLCTNAISPRQSTWGWAFRWVGAPWVAQRVCAIPVEPCSGSRSSWSASAATRAASFVTTTPPPFATASPAES